MLDQITPVILTYNEAANIGRTLERLAWAREVVVVDSLSTDDTVAIAGRFPNTRVVQRPFDTMPASGGLRRPKPESAATGSCAWTPTT